MKCLGIPWFFHNCCVFIHLYSKFNEFFFVWLFVLFSVSVSVFSVYVFVYIDTRAFANSLFSFLASSSNRRFTRKYTHTHTMRARTYARTQYFDHNVVLLVRLLCSYWPLSKLHSKWSFWSRTLIRVMLSILVSRTAFMGKIIHIHSCFCVFFSFRLVSLFMCVRTYWNELC